MEIWHRIVVRGNEPLREEFRNCGVEPPPIVDTNMQRYAKEHNPYLYGWTIVHIADFDERWPRVKEAVERHDLSCYAYAKFSKHDYLTAPYLCLDWPGGRGYPQPEKNFGFLNITYDGNGCAKCGVGYRQVAPFRLSSVPVWKRNKVFGVGWVFDAFFMPEEVFDAAFKPFGARSWPVEKHRPNFVIPNTVQLMVEKEVKIREEKLVADVCAKCGYNKLYIPLTSYVPSPAEDPQTDIFVSHQFFGSGGSADRVTYVSQRLYQHVKSLKLPGFHFSPCVPSD
jgi:hypothetical protein